MTTLIDPRREAARVNVVRDMRPDLVTMAAEIMDLAEHLDGLSVSGLSNVIELVKHGGEIIDRVRDHPLADGSIPPGWCQ